MSALSVANSSRLALLCMLAAGGLAHADPPALPPMPAPPPPLAPAPVAQRPPLTVVRVGKVLASIGGGVVVLGLAGMSVFGNNDQLVLGSAITAGAGAALMVIGLPLYIRYSGSSGTGG